MSNADNKPQIPAIVTTDLSSSPNSSTINLTVEPPDDHNEPNAASPESASLSPTAAPRSPPYASHLSPLNVPLAVGRSSLDAPSPYSPSLTPGSPSPSFTSSTETHVPPSPTLSTRSSVHFAPQQTSTALRHNRPEEKNGMSSLHLLTPDYNRHRRKGSFASSVDGSTEGTEPDTNSINMQPLTPQHTGDGSTIVSPTQTHCDAASDVDATTVRESSRSRPKLEEHPSRSSGENADEERAARPAIDLAQDEHIDAGPFGFKPYKLASLVDPKNIDLLKDMGGVSGLLQGLGTHRKRGLSKKALGKSPEVSHHEPFASQGDKDHRPGAGAGSGASQRHDREPETGASDVPKLVLTGPGDEDGGGVSLAGSRSDLGLEAGEEEQSGGSAYDANLEERRRVFGANTLPTRETKSLLQLMWLALKDKVLVRYSFRSTMSCSWP